MSGAGMCLERQDQDSGPREAAVSKITPGTHLQSTEEESDILYYGSTEYEEVSESTM